MTLNANAQMWLATSRPRPRSVFVEDYVCPADGDGSNTFCPGRKRNELLPRPDSGRAPLDPRVHMDEVALRRDAPFVYLVFVFMGSAYSASF